MNCVRQRDVACAFGVTYKIFMPAILLAYATLVGVVFDGAVLVLVFPLMAALVAHMLAYVLR